MCSVCAAVQDMDETANGGAQDFSLKKFNITTARFSTKEVDNLTGLVVGAPYLACTRNGVVRIWRGNQQAVILRDTATKGSGP